MTKHTKFEFVVVVENGEVVSFRLEDGSTADVPRYVVANSSLLDAALSDVSSGEDVKLKLPMGVMQKWLQCVGEEPYVLQLLKVRSSRRQHRSAIRIPIP